MPTLIKTLQATFVRPTAHKEAKLIELCESYREALHEAFDAGASTLSAVGKIVVPYDLPYQAKAAVCTFVRQLRQVDHAKELGDGQPVRFSNQAATFDHSSERTHGFTWWVPQPGWGTNFWIPLRINPAQETYWHDLVTEDADPGPIILRQRGATWELLVTVKYDVDEPKGDGEITFPAVGRQPRPDSQLWMWCTEGEACCRAGVCLSAHRGAEGTPRRALKPQCPRNVP